jgi:hypothetical protein
MQILETFFAKYHIYYGIEGCAEWGNFCRFGRKNAETWSKMVFYFEKIVIL